MGNTYTAYNAADACCALKSLMEFMLAENDVTLSEFSMSVASVVAASAWNAARKDKLGSYGHARSVKALSSGMASRCAPGCAYRTCWTPIVQ